MSDHPGQPILLDAPPTHAPAGSALPASPPAEVSVQVAAALERAEDLFAAGLQLHFAADPGTGRVVVELRDLRGFVLRRIPPSEALAIMSGEAAA